MGADIELTLLTEGQFFGNKNENQLEVIKKYGTKATLSDLATITGAHMLYCEGQQYQSRSSIFWLNPSGNIKFHNKTGNSSLVIPIVDNKGNERFVNGDSYCQVIRPVLKAPKIFSQIVNKSYKGYNNIDVVEFGEYPQMAALDYEQRNLENAYYNHNLSKTGKSYTLNIMRNPNNETLPVAYDEYGYNDEKYIRVTASLFLNTKVLLSRGTEVTNGNYIWIKISPIKWLIDYKSGLLISKKGLLSGIVFNNDPIDKDFKFENMYMYKFLNEFMLNDIMNMNLKLSNPDNEKRQKIDTIISEITDIVANYYDKDNVLSQIEGLIKQYNDNLNKIKNNFNNKIILTTDVMDKDFIYNKLINDLTTILNDIKIYSEKYKEYLLMIEYIDKIFSVLNNENDNIDNDDLLKDFETISKIILPFVDIPDEKNKLISIINQEKERINIFIKNNDYNQTNLEYKTLDEFKMYIRTLLHPYLIEINELVRNKNLINKVTIDYQNAIQNTYFESKSNYLNKKLSNLHESIDYIKKHGYSNEIEQLNSIINTDINTDDINELFGKINNVYKEVYKIYFDIYERNKAQDELESYFYTK